jgi:glutathione S-transferase
MTTAVQEARALLLGDGATRPKLEYFAIEGVAEQVRIALSVAGIPFDDVGIPFMEWQSKKSSTKFGQLPELTLPDGTIVTDSMAMLRLAGEADEEGKLYPTSIASRTKVESALGLVGDLTRAWSPALSVSMRPERFGYPPKEEWSDADVIVKKMRVSFVENDLPRFMEYFAGLIKENGGHFLTGDHLTIADIAAYQAIHYFRRGLADHVPKDCLEAYPEVLEWMGRVEGHAKVAAYMASKQAK